MEEIERQHREWFRQGFMMGLGFSLASLLVWGTVILIALAVGFALAD